MFDGGIPPSVPIANITTEEIQKCLEENKELIMAIMEYQKVGKFDECALHRKQLQRNLTFLTTLADALPQPPPQLSTSVPPQMLPHSIMQRRQCLQHPVAALVSQQHPASSFARIQLNDDQQQPSFLHQQQFIKAQVGINPIAAADVHMATTQIGVGSGSTMLDVRENNQVG